MRALRYILLPFSWLFGIIVAIRRALFNAGVFARKKGAIPTIVVGNITVGGTGKTPFVIWLSQMLTEKKPAVLSRGYGRKTKGFLEVLADSKTADCGDEPLELRSTLPLGCRNFVCEDRVEGIQQIKTQVPDCGLVVLDDGFQHLKLAANAYVLLCDYNRPFYHDVPMPAGRLREFKSAAKNATAIVVTKCPADLSVEGALEVYNRISNFGRPIFFATQKISVPCNSRGEKPAPNSKMILASALANNVQWVQEMGKTYQIEKHFSYRDHHAFDKDDIEKWNAAAKAVQTAGIATTRKDFMKLKELPGTEGFYVVHTETEMLFGGEDELIELLLKQID